jgi:hypothetical protein
MRIALVVTILSALATVSRAADRNAYTLRVEFEGREVEGLPLAWSTQNVVLLERDGRLLDVDPRRVGKFQKVNGSFQTLTPAAMQSRLREEFGKGFEVVARGPYLVVHPRGQGGHWSRRFEELYRSFIHYFSVRGFTLEEPQFPLVAVVLPNRADFLRYIDRQGDRVTGNVLGYYSSRTNRVAMFETPGDESSAWGEKALTIIHEATHQTAFNTGIHNRYSPPPRWVVEGLGTLFEAPGVWNSRTHLRQQDRLNREQLEEFNRQVAAGKRSEARFAELISSDRMFNTNVAGAYAESWAFTFYLVETQPRQFARYLKATASRDDFSDYPAAQRLKDFTAVFGENLRLLDAQFLRYIAGVK